jgi:hypothetical protein
VSAGPAGAPRPRPATSDRCPVDILESGAELHHRELHAYIAELEGDAREARRRTEKLAEELFTDAQRDATFFGFDTDTSKALASASGRVRCLLDQSGGP